VIIIIIRRTAGAPHKTYGPQDKKQTQHTTHNIHACSKGSPAFLAMDTQHTTHNTQHTVHRTQDKTYTPVQKDFPPSWP
jgi:hypothetical protein